MTETDNHPTTATVYAIPAEPADVYAIPAEPADVRAVSDCDGATWLRGPGRGEHWHICPGWPNMPSMGWARLLFERGPLTDVTHQIP